MCTYQNVQEMSGDEWCAIVDELATWGTNRVAFLGGEPLVRRDLDRLVGHARSVGLKCTLTSNGTLVARRPEVIQQLHTLVISLDGNADAHDANRGIGGHDRCMEAIEAARSWGIPVKLNAVLNVHSAGSLDWLLSFSARERLPLTLNFMRSEENGLWHDAARHRMHTEATRQLIDRIIEAKRTHPYIIFSSQTYRLARDWPDFTRDRFTIEEVGQKFPGPRCYAGRFHCAIYADGRLYPCCVTLRQVEALDVRTAGVKAALEKAGKHGCATCSTPCKLEKNALFGLQPAVVMNLAKVYLRSRLE